MNAATETSAADLDNTTALSQAEANAMIAKILADAYAEDRKRIAEREAVRAEYEARAAAMKASIRVIDDEGHYSVRY